MADLMDEELMATEEEMGAAGEAPPLAEEPAEEAAGIGDEPIFRVTNISELNGLSVGDELTFRVANISEDGIFELEVIAPMQTAGSEAEESGLTEALI